MRKIKKLKRNTVKPDGERYLTEFEIMALISNSLTFLKKNVVVSGGSIKSKNYSKNKGFKLDETGVYGNIDAEVPASALGWTNTLTFSAVDYNTVEWSGGAITLAKEEGGEVFNVVSGNTGDMSATTYIYLDLDVSETVLQTTTNRITANGANKIIVAVAYNNPDTASKASYQIFGGSGGQTIMTSNLVANSAVVNEFVSNSANIRDGVITNAKIANATITSAKIHDLHVDKLTGTNIVGKNIIGGEFRSTNGLGVISTDASGDIDIKGADDVVLWAGGTDRVQVGTNSFRPMHGGYDLGTGANYFNDEYISEVHFGDGWTMHREGGALVINKSGETYLKIDASDGDLHIKSSGSFKDDL